MTTDISKPIPVETPAQITVMESALIALGESIQSVHLSISQAQELVKYLRWFERIHERDSATISDLADRLSAYEVDAFEEGLDD